MKQYARFFKVIVFFSLLTVMPSSSFAQWMNYGCMNTDYYGFITAGNKLFLTTGGKLYESDDQGISWFHKTGFPGGRHSIFLANDDSLIVHMYNGFDTKTHLCISSDQGCTWSDVSGNLQYGSSVMASISVCGKIIFIGSLDGMLISADLGKTWSLISNGLQGYVYCVTRIGTDLYAGTDFGVFKAADPMGTNWISANEGIPVMNRNITAMAARNDTLYAGTGYPGRLYFSTDGAANWTLAGFNGHPVVKIIISGEYIYTTTLDGIYKGKTGGDWAYFGLSAMAPADICISGNNFFAGGSYGSNYAYTLLASYDAGATWGAIRAITNTDVNVTFCSGNNHILAGTRDCIYYSQDNGNSWEHASILNSGQKISYAAYGFSGKVSEISELFAATSAGVLKSVDGGRTWRVCGSPSPQSMAVLSYDNKVFAAASGGGIYLSTDRGETWSMTNSNIGVISCFLQTGKTAYAGGYDAVFELTSDGVSWAKTGEGISANINSLALAGGELFAGTGHGVMKFDETTSPHAWKQVNNGVNTYSGELITGLGNLLFAATYGRVFISRDGGDSWIDISDDFPSSAVTSIMAGNSTVFVSTVISDCIPRSEGIYKRSIDGLTGIVNNDKQAGFKVFPDPVVDKARLVLPKGYSGPVNIEIYSLEGKRISSFSRNGNQNSAEIDFSAYSSGMYFIRVNTGDFSSVQKILVSK
jgi:photosystem II stability/assembly factor-like uncharacterized protein